MLESDRVQWHRVQKRPPIWTPRGPCWSICTNDAGEAWASRVALLRKRFTIFIAKWRRDCSSAASCECRGWHWTARRRPPSITVADGAATYAYQGGVDPERLADEPGRLSTILCLRAAIEEGHRRVDFLRGDEPYKAHWRATPRATYDWRVIPNRRLARLRGRVWNVADTLGDWVRAEVLVKFVSFPRPVAVKDQGWNLYNTMFSWKEYALGAYYYSTLRARRRAAAQRASPPRAGSKFCSITALRTTVQMPGLCRSDRLPGKSAGYAAGSIS